MTFDKALSNKKLGEKGCSPVKLEAHELIKARYTFCMSVLREYASYAQCIENMKKAEVMDKVLIIADSMAKEFKLGSAFFDEISLQIANNFKRPATEVHELMQKGSGLEVDTFDYMMNVFSKTGIQGSFSPRFRKAFE